MRVDCEHFPTPDALRSLPRLRLIVTVGSALQAGWLSTFELTLALEALSLVHIDKRLCPKGVRLRLGQCPGRTLFQVLHSVGGWESSWTIREIAL
jgi:hypothetical protein